MQNKIFLFVMLVTLVGCSSQRRLARLLEKHPLPTDTVVVATHSVEYRDTLLFAYFPGDTVYRDTIIPFEVDMPYTELKTRSTMAEATAWIYENRLGLRLIQFDSIFEFKLDSAIRMDKDSVFVEVIREIPVEIAPKLFWKHGFLVLAGLILLSLILLLVLKRK